MAARTRTLAVSGKTADIAAAHFIKAREPIGEEVAAALRPLEHDMLAQAIAALLDANRIFVIGAGRSGLALRNGSNAADAPWPRKFLI